MKIIKRYAIYSLLLRLLLIALGIIIYLAASFPFEVNFHLFYAFCTFMIFEPLVILLIALLHEGPQNGTSSKESEES